MLIFRAWATCDAINYFALLEIWGNKITLQSNKGHVHTNLGKIICGFVWTGLFRRTF